jgi:mono/diheme cytochrome c family protein
MASYMMTRIPTPSEAAPPMCPTFTGMLSFIALATLSSAAVAADAANGEAVAKRWCAACHLVATDQQRGNTQAPPFSAIASLPGFDSGKLALFLLEPHPKMPNLNLSRNQANDLAAYIAIQGK